MATAPMRRLAAEASALQELYLSVEREAALQVCDGCDQCGTRCVDGFELTGAEFEAILAFLGATPESELYAVLSQPKRREWGAGAWVDLCLFRDEQGGRCLIYPVRPFICRLFGHVEWMPCPISKVPSYSPHSQRWLWQYVQYQRRTMRRWIALHPDADWLRQAVAAHEHVLRADVED